MTVNKDNGHGATIMWYPFLGSDYVQADQENNWYASSNSKYGTTSTTNWWTTNDSTWEITGVQLEVGEQATAFEFHTHAEELLRCQRYYYQNTSSPLGAFMADAGDPTVAYGFIRFPTPMRTSPTVVLADNNGNTGDSYVFPNATNFDRENQIEIISWNIQTFPQLNTTADYVKSLLESWNADIYVLQAVSYTHLTLPTNREV